MAASRLLKRQKDLHKLALSEKLNRLNYYAQELQQTLNDCDGIEHRLRQDAVLLSDVVEGIISNCRAIESLKNY